MNYSVWLFLKKLLLFGLIVYCTDYSLGKLLEHYYLRMKATTPEYHTTYALNNADDDIIVFGSSRANHHYDPDPFEDKLNKTFYNTGRDGQGILFAYALLKNIMQRSDKSRIILLDLHPTEFNKNQEAYDRLSELLPYYYSNKAVQQVVNLKGPYEKIKSFSYLYRYNSLLLTILMHNTFPRLDNVDKGYDAIEKGNWDVQLIETSIESDIDSLEVQFFTDFVREAKNANYEVFVIVSPSYRKYNQLPKTITIAQKICKEMNVSFLNFNQDSVFLKNPKFFADPAHLNEEGAEFYSELVSDKLYTIR